MNITGNKCFALIDNSTVYAGDCVKLKYFNNKGEELKEEFSTPVQILLISHRCPSWDRFGQIQTFVSALVSFYL